MKMIHWLFAMTASLFMSVSTPGVRAADTDREEKAGLKKEALCALLVMDSEKAIPLLRNILDSTADPKLKQTALLLLAQKEGDKAFPMLKKIIGESKDTELRRQALMFIGLSGNAGAEKFLMDVINAKQ